MKVWNEFVVFFLIACLAEKADEEAQKRLANLKSREEK